MASSDEESAEMAGLRKRIEHGLMLLRKEANASTKERMKAAIQADRDRLRQLESDQTPSRKPQRIVPERLKSKVWEIIEEASRYQEVEHQQDEATGNSNNSFFTYHHHPREPTPQAERDTATTRPNTPKSPRTPSATRDEDEKRRAQIIAELQRRREVLLSQLSPDPPAPKPPTAEEHHRAEEVAKRKREQARLDLKTAIPRERSAGGGVTYALVSPTVGSFGPDVHERLQRASSTGAPGMTRTASATTPTRIMKEPQRTVVPTFRVSSSATAATTGSERKSTSRRPTENRGSSTSGDRESRTSQRPQQQFHHRHHDPRSPRSETTPYPPRSRADRPPIHSPVYSDNEQQLPRLRRRDSERSSSTASSSNIPSNDRMANTTSATSSSRRRERDRERGDNTKSSSTSGEAPRRTRRRSLSRDDGRRSNVPPPAPAPPVPGSLLEELLKKGPWRAS